MILGHQGKIRSRIKIKKRIRSRIKIKIRRLGEIGSAKLVLLLLSYSYSLSFS